MNRVKDLKILPDETLVSYDVVAMYPSIPQDRAIDIVYQKLVNDTDLIDKTKMTPTEVIELLQICVGEVYFVFNNKIYIQIKGLAIGYSSSGFTADIFMETIETRALQTFINPPSFWARFVDDVYSNPKTITKDRFLTHLKDQDPNIDWTSEEEQDNTLPYIDARTHRNPDGSLRLTVYRKPTHTDQYLNFQSNHHISHKLAVPKTLLHRADTVITDENDMPSEEKHIKRALKNVATQTGRSKGRKSCQNKNLLKNENRKKRNQNQ